MFFFKASLWNQYSFRPPTQDEDDSIRKLIESGCIVHISWLRLPAHMLHSGIGQEEVLLGPALPGCVDLAGPLGLLLFPPATTGYCLAETVVRPSTGTRQHGMFHPHGWKNGTC